MSLFVAILQDIGCMHILH